MVLRGGGRACLDAKGHRGVVAGVGRGVTGRGGVLWGVPRGAETRRDYIRDGEYSYGLETMELRQRLHDGDRSHPRVVALDETKADLSYPGWRSDAAQAEMASHPRCWSLPHHLESTVAKMKRKQEYHEACPPNVLTAVCRSGASQVGHCLHLSGERFGYGCTLGCVYVSFLLTVNYGACKLIASRA